MTNERAAEKLGENPGALKVVGEQNYQDALWAAVRQRVPGRTADRRLTCYVNSRLAAEPRNPFDPNAVRVTVGGSTVGYLTRQDAARLHETVARPLAVRAVISGAGPNDFGGYRHLGIFLLDADGENSTASAPG